jgi:hypothetical protein
MGAIISLRQRALMSTYLMQGASRSEAEKLARHDELRDRPLPLRGGKRKRLQEYRSEYDWIQTEIESTLRKLEAASTSDLLRRYGELIEAKAFVHAELQQVTEDLFCEIRRRRSG